MMTIQQAVVCESTVVSEGADGQIGRRMHSRLRVSLPARVVSIHGDQRIQVENISQTGMKLRWKQQVRPHSDVVLSFAGIELFGKVVWATNENAGISLDQPLPVATILALRDEANAPPVERRRDDTMWALQNWRRTGGRY